PRVILIEHTGKLVGLITVKDVLKYIARREAEEESIRIYNASSLIELTNNNNNDSPEENRNLRSPMNKKRGSVSFLELGKSRDSDL
ncbi:20567_t:CDS:1, partial [Dentiscutata erythropus]